jgi:hypothetical protein
MCFQRARNLAVALLCLSWLLMISPKNFWGKEAVTANEISHILPERERALVMNDWLKWRLENILPEIMRREKIDMWLVVNREYNEDPVFMSLVPQPAFPIAYTRVPTRGEPRNPNLSPQGVITARGTSILVFYDQGKELGVERLTGTRYHMDEFYKETWKDKNKTQFESLAELLTYA